MRSVPLETTLFGALPDGRPVRAFRLRNAAGMEVEFLALGGIITAIRVPDREGRIDNVTLALGSVAEYLADRSYLGALIGRCANRIAGAAFVLDGERCRLEANDGANHLHGGSTGFHRALWEVEPLPEGSGARLTHLSPDGEGGYPGTLRVVVTYTLTEANELAFDFVAATDRPTPVNLTQHLYLNLSGPGSDSILGHELMIPAREFTPVDGGLIPTGELRAVSGSPFDFTTPAAIGARIDADDEQLRRGRGYDHNFVLGRQPSVEPAFAARLVDPGSGRGVEVRTTEPGLQFYSGNFLGSGGPGGRGAHRHAWRSGLALETQHYPDSPNQPAFPPVILRPGEVLRSRTVYRFHVEGAGPARA